MADRPDATPVLIRAVRPDDDLDAQLDLAERSFGPGSPAGRDQWRRAIADPIVGGRSLGAFDGDRLVGAAIFHDMRQWWCGTGPPLTLGARGLAALYAGTPLGTLRQAGLAAGGTPEDDAALDAAFAATPYMLDAF